MRDYDKRPIVIKDNSLLFVFIFVLPVLIVDFIYLLLGAKRFLSAIIAFGIVAYILPYVKNKNYIAINSDSVNFLENGNIIRQKSVIISISPNTNYERTLIKKFFKDNFNIDIEKAEKLLTFDWE